MNQARLLHCAELWLGGWRGPSVLSVSEGSIDYLGPSDETAQLGTVLPGFVDSHVHLGLVDVGALVAGGLARVVDLGWTPQVVAGWAGKRSADFPEIEFVGGFLTAPGGYPSGRDWAPADSVLEIDTAERGASVVAQMCELGASAIKIALNTEAGPVLNDELLVTVIERAHEFGMPVFVHAQGEGQAVRAARAAADYLAHAPWSERLPDADLADMVARGCGWVSTLDIHGWGDPTPEFFVAQDNLARFVSFGGRVRYGTDLGNGPLPPGINVRELTALAEAGLSIEQLIRALVGAPESLGNRVSVIAEPRPATASDDAAWLASATVFDAGRLMGMPGDQTRL